MTCSPEAFGPLRLTRSGRPGPSWLTVLLLALASACGSAAGSTGQAAESAGTHAEDDTNAAIVAPTDHCADGSCFLCGDGLCPRGFYCDEDAAGGPACSWLTACPTEPTCACLASELGADCRCETRHGGVHVSCP